MSKRIVSFSVLFAVVGTIVGASAHELLVKRARHRAPSGPLRAAELSGAPTLGRPDAKVTVVLWGDLDCPHTAAAYTKLRRLAEDPASDVRLVWKDNPIAIHPTALRAARTAMAAQEQGKFWEYAAALLKDPDRVGDRDPDLAMYEAKLDVARYRAAIKDGHIDRQLQNELVEAGRLAVLGTPTLFINGRAVEGVPPDDDLTVFIEEARLRADALLDHGVPRERLYAALVASAPHRVPSAIGSIPIASERQQIDTTRAPARGGAHAPVEIVMFGDYECPFCKDASEVLTSLVDRYPGGVRFVWKHHPLAAHAHAMLAAKAATAAAQQGRFWQMHDLIFANQGRLERDDLISYASRAGLDVARFRTALDSGLQAEVDQQLDEGDRLVGAPLPTPTFFINGRRLVGLQPIEVFNALIQQELSPNRAPGALAAK